MVVQGSLFSNIPVVLSGYTHGLKEKEITLKIYNAFQEMTLTTTSKNMSDKFEFKFIYEVPFDFNGNEFFFEFSDNNHTILIENVKFGDVYICAGKDISISEKLDINVIDAQLLRSIYVFNGNTWLPVYQESLKSFRLSYCLASMLSLAKMKETISGKPIGLIYLDQIDMDMSLKLAEFVIRGVVVMEPGSTNPATIDELLYLLRSTKNIGDFPAVVASPINFDKVLSRPFLQESYYLLSSQNLGVVETLDLDFTEEKHILEIGRRIALMINRLSFTYDSSKEFAFGPMMVNASADEHQVLMNYRSISFKGVFVDKPNKTVECNMFSVQSQGNWLTINDSYTKINEAKHQISFDIRHLAIKDVSQIRYNYKTEQLCHLKNKFGLPSKVSVTTLEEELVSTKMEKQTKFNQKRKTPVMGFNPWNSFHCNVDEDEIEKAAKSLLALGLFDAGYTYINLDDCWQRSRTLESDRIVEDFLRFPNGIAKLSNKLHQSGFHLGLYTSSTSLTCQYRPGSYRYEAIDVKKYCQEYDVDFIKIDNCFGLQYEKAKESWNAFKAAIDKYCPSNVIISVEYCSTPTGCGDIIANLSNMWRTTADISNNWKSIMKNVHLNDKMALVAKPGHYNDPDMLEIGNTGLTIYEQRTQFSLWCLVSAPLLIGTDLTKIKKPEVEILKNKHMIAINQDAGLNDKPQGTFIKSFCLEATNIRLQRELVGTDNCHDELEIWRKTLSNSCEAVAVVNTGKNTLEFKATHKNLFTTYFPLVYDIWNDRLYRKTFTVQIESHDTKVFLGCTQKKLQILMETR